MLTWGVALDDGQVVQLQRGVAAAAGEAHDVVLPVVDELGALLDVDVVRAHVEHHTDVALVLRKTHIESRSGFCTYRLSLGQFLTLWRETKFQGSNRTQIFSTAQFHIWAKRSRYETYYLQLEVVSQAGRAVHT